MTSSKSSARFTRFKRLRARADIDHAEPNYVLHPMLAPDDPRYPTQWHYPLIGLPQAWGLSTGSSSIIVAVVDTGVFLAHSELQAKLIAGYDFIQDPARAFDGDGIDPNPDDPGDGFVLELSSFHGTHVAGTVGAETNNELGVAGVSWGAQIMPVRVLGQGGGTSFDVLEGVRYAAGLENTSGNPPAAPGRHHQSERRRLTVLSVHTGCLHPGAQRGGSS